MTLGRPSSAAGAGVETEASTRPGTPVAGRAVEPDAQPATRGRRRVGRQVHMRAAGARANPFTPPPDGTAAPWR